MEDGGTDVAREGVGLGGGRFRRVIDCGDWSGVEAADNIDVGVVDGGDGGGSGGSCDGGAELVGIGRSLGSEVVGGGGWGGVLRVAGACHGHVVGVFDVAGEDGIDAVANGAVD